MIQVIKTSGALEDFSIDKVRQSLIRAGAANDTIDKILMALKPKLYNKISTQEVYRLVYGLLDEYQRGRVHSYGLKPALMDLGPSGYPFEKFIAKLFEKMGYQAVTGQIIAGQCVDHEVDVVAEKGAEHLLIECKFHQHPGNKTDVKDTLYIQARFEDINQKFPGKYQSIWLVTNTKLTSQAIAYGTCRNMRLLAWQYPLKDSLESLLDRYQIHPLTCLTFLTKIEKQLLFNQNLVLCSELKQLKDKQLADLGLSSQTIKRIRSALN